GFKPSYGFWRGNIMYNYKIKKIINNNIVSSTDKADREIIIRGLGIGFQKSPVVLFPKTR
ncbi:MAG: hypothetical protein LUD77_01230, partial [Clostridiales bacterium]|nr:hypothetical protein [Clostridiales bacterium]